jgi:serine/threonine-protein kinase
MLDWTAIRRKHVGGFEASRIPDGLTIPVMPHALIEFSQRADDPAVSSDDLARTIEHEGSLTCELLRYVNSSALGVRQRVSTARLAINLLGFHRSKMLLLSAAVERAMKPSDLDKFDYNSYMNSNIERALFAAQIAARLGADEDLAFAAGMLSDCIIPAASTNPRIGIAYKKYHSADNATKPRLIDFEQKLLGWEHAAIASQIMLGWQFPDDLVCCVAFHHQFARLLADPDLKSSPALAVALAAMLPDSLNQEPMGLIALTQIAKASRKFDLLACAAAIRAPYESLASPAPAGKPYVALVERLESSLAA